MAMTMVHMAITKGFVVPAPFLSRPGVVVMAHPRQGGRVQPHVGVVLWRGGGVPKEGLARALGAVVLVLPESLVAVGTGLGDCLSGRESLPCRPR